MNLTDRQIACLTRLIDDEMAAVITDTTQPASVRAIYLTELTTVRQVISGEMLSR